jgi:hypothetical protein
MELDVVRAREWVLANQAAILQALASEDVSEVRKDENIWPHLA